MTKGIIYSWLNKKNGKEYIGQTIHERRRYNEHKRAANGKELAIDKAIAKYGVESFRYSVIVTVAGYDKKEVRERLNELEVKYIADRKTHHTQGGYNITWGGSDTGNYQHKENIRKAHPHIEVQMLDLDGNIVAKFVSVKEAERQTGINKGGISACIHGRQSTTTGKDGIKYSWKKA